MGKIALILIVLILIGAAFLYLLTTQRSKKEIKKAEVNLPTIMKLESSAFKNNEPIPAKYTCDGENINPPLKISNVSKVARSLVLIVDDPDAPVGTWVHWTVFNISSKITEILENSVPSGATEGITSFDKPGWGGPCPHSGTHHYLFKLYALDAYLTLKSQARAEEIVKAMENRIIDEVSLVGLYKRQ